MEDRIIEDIDILKKDVALLRAEMVGIRSDLALMRKAAMKIIGVIGGVWAIIQGGSQFFGG